MYVPAARAGIGYCRLSGPVKISPLKTTWPVPSAIWTLWVTPGSLLVKLITNGWPAGACRLAVSYETLWAVRLSVVAAGALLPADGAGGGVLVADLIWVCSQALKSAWLSALT